METNAISTQSAAVIAQTLPAARRAAAASWAPLRRGARLTLDIALEIYGQGLDGKIFREETRTRVISEHGALVSLDAEVAVGQTIVLVCKRGVEEMHCRVVSREFEKGEYHVGLTFLDPSPRFWGVNFPPAA